MAHLRGRRLSSTCKGKDTRWDRIRKRHTGSSGLCVTNAAVRRLIEMDFIGKRNESILTGANEQRPILNPHLVMDMRHQMKNVRKLPLATLANKKNTDACIAHNIFVEERCITNELNKLRNQLQKNRQRLRLNVRTATSLKVDNKVLVESLAVTSKHFCDFYTAPIEAMQEFDRICAINNSMDKLPDMDHVSNDREKDTTVETTELNNDEQPEEHNLAVNGSTTQNNEDKEHHEESETQSTFESYEILENQNFPVTKLIIRTPSPLTPTDEFLKPLRAVIEQQRCQRIRCVRFEDEEDINVGIAHDHEHGEDSVGSNTSDDIDSVISDLAEEALYELQMEEQAKMQATEPIPNDLSTEKTEDNKNSVNMQLKGEAIDRKQNPEDMLLVSRLNLPPCNVAAESRTKLEDLSSMSEDEDTASNPEQAQIIKQLFQPRAKSNDETLKKYFGMWMHYTTIAKIERDNISRRDDRIHKINCFLDKIRKEKVRLTNTTKAKSKDDENEENTQPKQPRPPAGTVQIAKKYQNKIKIQQDIIDLQRVKLERQERIIMELRLNKLSDEAKEARQELKNELKSVIASGDPKSKAKAKCLQIIGSMHDQDEDENRLQCKALLVPTFLKKMQERALERSIRHEQARQRRLQQDAEREAQKIAAEEAKRLEDEEAKRMRMEMLREKRRQEKMAKILKERERIRALENKRKSDGFYRCLLLRRIGIEGFKRLLQRKRDCLRKSEELKKTILKRTYFYAWYNHNLLLQQMKRLRADQLHEQILKRNTIRLWLLYVKNERSKYLFAMDWYDLKLNESYFERWHQYTKAIKMSTEAQMRKATAHHEWHLKWKVLDCWRNLPQILQLEKETEERRQRWRMKIWELLPDYEPNTDSLWLK